MKKYTQHPDCDADHPDFTIRSIPAFQDGALGTVELLLPVGERISQLVNQRGAEARARLEAQMKAAAVRTEVLLEKVVKTPEPRSNDREGGRFSPAVEREALFTQYGSQRELFQGASDQVQIDEWDEPCRLLESAASSPGRQLRDRCHAFFFTLSAQPCGSMGTSTTVLTTRWRALAWWRTLVDTSQARSGARLRTQHLTPRCWCRSDVACHAKDWWVSEDARQPTKGDTS